MTAARITGTGDDPALYATFVGRNWRTTRQLLIDAIGDDATRLLELWTDEFERRVRAGEIRKKPGADHILTWLRNRGIPTALATSTGRAKALAQLEDADLLDHFPAVAAGDEVTNGKPAPDIYLLAAERLGHDPRVCVALEDSEPGVQAASAAGIRVVMVPDLNAPGPDTRALAARICSNLIEAQLFLESLGSANTSAM
jgi:HAD superfamily hydrolase (TIGR01509 family)